MKTTSDKIKLLSARELLHRGLATECRTARSEPLRIFQNDRTPCLRVACAGLQRVVRMQSFLEIIRRANVERMIGTFEDIHEICHVLARAFAMEQHVNGMFHGARFRHGTGIDEIDLVGILDCIQAVRDDDACRFGRKFLENFFE